MDKSYLIRTTEELFKEIRILAAYNDMSINEYINTIMKEAAEQGKKKFNINQ